MSEFDDDFLVRPGRSRAERGGLSTGSFLGQVKRATALANDPGAGARLGRAVARGGLTRGAGRSANLTASRRRVVVKTRVVRHRGSRFRAAPLARHIAYLEREGVTRDGEKAAMFDATGERADVAAFAARCQDDRHHFRFIISPEDAPAMSDLRGFARDLMARAELDLGARLDWVAVDHWNTDNPHLHVLVRGRAQGRDLVIAGDYLAQGLRGRAQDLVTLELGPRTAREIAKGLDAEIAADRWTGLDRGLVRKADDDGRLDLRRQAGDPDDGRRALGRASHLQKLGLAEPLGPARWRLAPDFEARLRDLSIRGDIIKTLHRAMAGEGRAVEPGRFVIHDDQAAQRVVGRLVERGLRDELTGSAYAIIDGLDGRQHHLGFADLEDTGDARPGAIVELRAPPSARTRFLATRSDLSLDGQIHAEGATWLDRRILRQAQGGGEAGFGAEATAAAESRIEVLLARGLAERRDGRMTFAPRLLATLQTRELEAVRARIAGETGLSPLAEAQAGETFAGVYRRRLDLASGRFAMIEDGLGFRLAPWRPGLEPHLGRTVMGRVAIGGEVTFEPGRARGLGL